MKRILFSLVVAALPFAGARAQWLRSQLWSPSCRRISLTRPERRW